ncbi:methyltransferase family protein [Breoghania corrubedonensis]|uniref:Methyltransferase family protein n=1 Tax=Breoghania corrubedonensis TaxID=665038 RepID=A0A2T5V9J7_9HYPH|nr:class I SAM-dependent methyltransferase [Breoghania corrubedonensis]PTW60427.1 methyltransferase family protein [Breoghania corrubedonensis]
MDIVQFNKKSSFHWVCGDGPLGFFDKALYNACQRLERVVGNLSQERGACEPYEPELDVERLVGAFGPTVHTYSPTRILCYDFLLNRASGIFGEAPDLVDLGCGAGTYSHHLKKVTRYCSYQGYDIEPRSTWAEYAAPSVTFAKARLGYEPLDVGPANAVFSQSVLEHIEFDRSAIALLRPDGERTLTHLHMIPGIPSFFEHRYHGYRRYGARAVRNLVDLPGISDVEVHHFGNWVTREFFWDMRNRHKPQVSHSERKKAGVSYDTRLSALENLAIHRDKILTRSMAEASFLALTFKQATCP